MNNGKREAYITSMNFAKVFRRHHRSKEPSERPTYLPPHHQYSRPFSYHMPSTEQFTPSPLIKTSTVVPYRIGLSSDSTLLNNGQTNETDEIVRLPIKHDRGPSPKVRRDRRYQSQLNANKRWLFRSMETLDGWKGKVFAPKTRTSNSSQSRSRSVENLADEEAEEENRLSNHKSSRIKQQRAVSPNRSIEAITNRVINSIGIHRKSAQSVPNIARSPALTIQKQSLLTQGTNGKSKPYHQNGANASAILDFRELFSSGLSHSRPRLSDDNEDSSLTPSETNDNDVRISDEENEDVISNLSFPANAIDNETADSWDFSITWIDSLKEQHSPQRKIQFYENLIKLLEQDTLNIDELLVLRKVLSKIWPIDEAPTSDYHNQLLSMGTKSLHAPNKDKRRSKLSTMSNHTAQRCSAIIEQSPPMYEALHEQYSGHGPRAPVGLLTTKAKPCFIAKTTNGEDEAKLEPNYPEHLNPFDDETDIQPSAPPEESNQDSNDSIRRYFERLTLLETIYEKLNIESNKTPGESTNQEKLSSEENPTQSHPSTDQRTETKEEVLHHSHPYSLKKLDKNKTIPSKFVEMNVDGNGSISSRKSSLKRRAPTAPHVTQNNNNPTMFTLSSADLNTAPRIAQEINKPARLQTSDQQSPKEKNTSDTVAACDDDGHIFVYDSNPTNETAAATLPRQTDRIQQWLSACETKEDLPLPSNISPQSQLKIRCMAKSIRHSSPSAQHTPEKSLSPPIKNEIEPGRFRSCLKIHLETNEPSNHRTRASSATSKRHLRQSIISNDHFNISHEKHFSRNTLSPTSFQRDHQAVYL